MNINNYTCLSVLGIIVLGGWLTASDCQGRIKLTTLPERESVRIDIQNGRFTLVEEERIVNLQQGENTIDFSWANIGIDKDSIILRVVQAPGIVNVINTNFPNNENALFWTVSAEKAGPAKIRISYLIGNMEGTPSYQGIVSNDEKSMILQVYMTVTNTSGESFDKTTIQPGVGKTSVDYFKNGERKRMLAAKFSAVPVDKRYVYNQNDSTVRMYYRIVNDKDHRLGEFPLPYGKIRLFIQESADVPAVVPAKGEAKPVAVAETATNSSQAFLGEDWAKYTPLFAPQDLFIGAAKDVKVKRFEMPLEGKQSEASVVQKVECEQLDGSIKEIESSFRQEQYRIWYRLQNFKTNNDGQGTPVELVLQEKMGPLSEWEIVKVAVEKVEGERNEQKSTPVPTEGFYSMERKDIQTAEFKINLPPTPTDTKYDLYMTIVRKWVR